MVPNDGHVAIIGSGAWGLSTALHLRRAGYLNITVFDRAAQIPSCYSAGWDINKIVRAEYEDEFYSKLSLEAIAEWKGPLFAPHYHQTGYIVATSGNAPKKVTKHLEKALASIETGPTFAGGIRRLHDAKDFNDYAWQFSGPMSGFKGYYNRVAGYVHSSDVMKAVWEHCASQGVKFILGEDKGAVVSLNYSGESKCVGVTTRDGKQHPADLTICAAGAYTASLVPSIGNFTTARCWSVAHVQLTEEEANLLRGIPTTNIRDLGFFFEPDPKTKLFKLCPLGIGYTNTNKDTGVSLPPIDLRSTRPDFIPIKDEEKLRQLLHETLPWMADRPFVDKRLCWFSDTRDSNYCIDFVPDTGKSVICLAGDSGHGFKMMPIFGRWVVDLIHAGKQDALRWQWRETDLRGENWADDVSWRIGTGAELRDLIREDQT
ncbi:hypothetical protein V490_02687 [Pseudogymnoascus sp. VKM F-3557]|nr:hypothetical protein V490_02687 [Pseudogymnoascus sp. VKM F-3557]